MKKLILVAGPPACGKTYVSRLIAKNVGHIVYLDKDDLGDLLRAAFCASGKAVDMDGDFYRANLQNAEYSAILNIAFSALAFADCVILNAPFVRQVLDGEYMLRLKKQANEMNAQLLLIWVTAPLEVCYERMKSRNSDRDILKLENWDAYARKIDFAAPNQLKETDAVDALLVFDTKDTAAVQLSLKRVLKIIRGD